MERGAILRVLSSMVVFVSTSLCCWASDDWLDAFYPYRIPIAVSVPAAGEYQLDLAPETVTDWINDKADFQFDPKYFGYDNIKLVEIDSQRRIVNQDVDAGYRILIGRELIVNGDFEKHENGKLVGWQIGHKAFTLKSDSHDRSWCMTTEGADRNGCVQSISTEVNRWYRFSCRAKGPVSVNAHYFPKGNWWRVVPHTYKDPYVPAEGWYQIAYFFNTWDKAGWEIDQVQVRMERYTGAADEISVRECLVSFVLKADRPGDKRYLLYYSPIEGNTPTVPSRQIQTIPDRSLPVRRAGDTEYLEQGLRYSLASNPLCDVWYSSTMKKVMERDPPPKTMRQKVRFSAARNESEAIQLVLRPKSEGEIHAVSATLTGPSGYVLPSDCFDMRRAKYVTIETPSRTGPGYRDVCRSAFTGRLPDPLPKFVPAACNAGEGNIIVWVDVTVPKDAPAGLYQGELGVDTSSGRLAMPWELRVWSPKVWWMGARGMATWATTLWWKERDSLDIENPWKNPFTPWGNGVLAYFYPPHPKGTELPQKDLSIVPSLRMVLTRDGIEDYEYAAMLQRLLAARRPSDAGVAEGKEALARMRRQFRTPVTWTLGEAHWEQTRTAAARAIEVLSKPDPSG